MFTSPILGRNAYHNTVQLATHISTPQKATWYQSPEIEDYHVPTAMGADSYRKLVLKGGRLVGALMAGDIEAAGLCTSLIKRGDHVSASFLERLMVGRTAHAAWLTRWPPPHRAMPDARYHSQEAGMNH